MRIIGQIELPAQAPSWYILRDLNIAAAAATTTTATTLATTGGGSPFYQLIVALR